MTADKWTAIFTGVYAFFTGVLTVTGIWALIYTKRQLKQAHEADKVQHLIRFVEQFESEPMASYRRTTADKRTKGTPYPTEAQNILNFFETIGLLVKREYLDLDDVWSCFGYWMFNVYADFREDIEQEQREDPSYYQDFCTLIDRLRKIEVEEGGKADHPSREEIPDFWRDETKLRAGAPARRRKARKRKSKADDQEQKSDATSTK